MALAHDIAQQIARDFPEEEVAPVTAILGELREQDPKLFSDRILRCLVLVAAGRFAALSDAVALARLDYRDLIVSAEYDRHLQQIRDLDQPFDTSVA